MALDRVVLCVTGSRRANDAKNQPSVTWQGNGTTIPDDIPTYSGRMCCRVTPMEDPKTWHGESGAFAGSI